MKRTIKELLETKRVFFAEDNTQNSLKGLYDLIKDVKKIINKKTISMIEVGSFSGLSTELFAKSFSHVDAVDAWDLFPDCFGIELDDLKTAESSFDKMKMYYDNIRKIKAFSDEASTMIPDNSVDFIYLDGDHRYDEVKKDINKWLPKIKKNGIIAGHDYTNILSVRKAVDEIFKKPYKLYKDCSWMVKL